jgi:hypothetical protein
MNFFMAGRDLVRWWLEVVDSTGGARHVRLTMQHAVGSIVEYFPTTETALLREQELEKLLIAARGHAPVADMEFAR